MAKHNRWTGRADTMPDTMPDIIINKQTSRRPHLPALILLLLFLCLVPACKQDDPGVKQTGLVQPAVKPMEGIYAPRGHMKTPAAPDNPQRFGHDD